MHDGFRRSEAPCDRYRRDSARVDRAARHRCVAWSGVRRCGHTALPRTAMRCSTVRASSMEICAAERCRRSLNACTWALPLGRLDGRCCSNGAAWCFSTWPRKISKNIFEPNEKNGRAWRTRYAASLSGTAANARCRSTRMCYRVGARRLAVHAARQSDFNGERPRLMYHAAPKPPANLLSGCLCPPTRCTPTCPPTTT